MENAEISESDGWDGSIHVHVGVGPQMSSGALVHVVKELICYVLFMHHQMPCMYSQLESELDLLEDAEIEEGRAEKRRRMRQRKKLQKLKSSVDKLLTTIESAIVAFYPNLGTVLLLLGSTPLRPQEVYEIHVPCRDATGKVDELDSSQQSSNNLFRKLIRLLIASGARGSSEGLKKLFVLIQAPASSACPSEFLPKRGFSWKRKKVVPVVIHLSLDITTAAESRDNLRPSDSNVPNDMIWFQSRVSVKGWASGVTGE